MTNYMGKQRLLNILRQMLSDRPKIQEQIKSGLAQYKKFRGDEWLKVWLDDCRFKIYVSGSPCKVVSFEEYRTDIYSDVMSQYNRILTKYNENFEPLPLATWLSGGCELRKRGYYPFHIPVPDDIDTSEADGLNPDFFVCYDIAKRSKTEIKEAAG